MNVAAFLSYVIVVNYTPGPNNLICLSNGLTYGFRRSLPYMFGAMTGFTAMLLASSFLNHYIQTYLPMAEQVLKVAGAVFLIYLALLILGIDVLKWIGVSASTAEVKHLSTTSFSTGLMMQFVNVKAILYCLTVIGTFIAPYYQAWHQLAIASMLLGLIGFSSMVLWALFGTFFKRFMATYARLINGVMAALLIYSALVVLGALH